MAGSNVFRKSGVRVKRWSKSPPLQAQARRHGKPHRVQGQIGDHGAARSMARVGSGPGYWLLRQMILSSDIFGEDKIRLTAFLKSSTEAFAFGMMESCVLTINGGSSS